MPSSRRCVFGCVTKGYTVHSFPNPAKFPERFRTWVELGGEKLENLSVEDIYPRMKVCDKHFIESHRNRNNRLNALAIPTLHIPQSRPETINVEEESERVVMEDNANVSIGMAIELVNQESCPEPNFCEANESIVMKDNTNLSIDMAINSVNQGSSSYVKNYSEPESIQIELPSSSQSHHITGPHTEKNICFEEKGSNKQNLPKQINFPSALCLSGAVIGVNDHDYCARSVEKLCKITQVERKPAATKKIKGSIKRTSNLTYYMEEERKTRNLRREIIRLRKRCKSFKSRLDAAIKMSDSKAFQRVTANMSLPAKIFAGMQFREAKKKPKGRRFTLEEKILSLSFYKRSPKSYTLLHKSFTLPSSKCLRNLLGKIKIAPGINKMIFEKMSQTVADMNDDDRLCVIMFDEMSINPQVHYDLHNDELKGFVTISNKNKIANHALTFMVRGIKKNYKQPVAYYFTQSLNKIELKQCIKEVLRHVKSTGLKVVATVCDQSTVNVGAIESLIQDTKTIYLKKGLAWRNDIFMVDNCKVIPIYDVPHLIKGIRNNLITKDLKYVDFEDENKEKILKWEYFQQLYEADKSQGELKYLLKLTEEHVISEKINKMKVKTATQLFSHSVAVTANHLTATGQLDTACRQITPIVKVFDNLFDSLNCNTFGVVNGKIFRSGVKRNSPHHKLWQDSLKFLKHMKYLEKKKDGSNIIIVEKVVPSIKNFIKTIEGMQAIWKVLHEKHGFDTMLCRNFNQDPIENFFGSVRSLGVRNISPNTISFEGAFKSLLLNNFSSSHSIKSNCEEDVSTFLQSVDFFIKEYADDTTNADDFVEETEPLKEIIINEELFTSNNEIEGLGQKSYVCGWVLKKCTKIIKNCKNCKCKLFMSDHIPAHAYIVEKEYCNKSWLCYPSMVTIKCFDEISSIITNVLKRNLNTKKVKQNIKMFTDIFVNYEIFDCHDHKKDLRTLFENLIINVTLYSWCRSINRILCGKMSYDGDDETKICAQMYYTKHKHYKNKK